MLGAVCGAAMDEVGTGTRIAVCSVLSSMDGSGESESRFWNQYLSERRWLSFFTNGRYDNGAEAIARFPFRTCCVALLH
jgi:hypothetical protein